MKKRRRYRQKDYVSLSLIGQLNRDDYPFRIHDFAKGWGTVYKDKSVLWDCWRPLTKKELHKIASESKKRLETVRKNNVLNGKHPDDPAPIFMPVIKGIIPTLSPADIISVQPMTNKDLHTDW